MLRHLKRRKIVVRLAVVAVEPRFAFIVGASPSHRDGIARGRRGANRTSRASREPTVAPAAAAAAAASCDAHSARAGLRRTMMPPGVVETASEKLQRAARRALEPSMSASSSHGLLAILCDGGGLAARSV